VAREPPNILVGSFLHPTDVIFHDILDDYGDALHLSLRRVIEVSIPAARLILSMERHPGLKRVLSHTGGALPYQAGRMDKNSTAANLPRLPSAYMKRMYTDTVSPHGMGMRFALRFTLRPSCTAPIIPAGIRPPRWRCSARSICQKQTGRSSSTTMRGASSIYTPLIEPDRRVSRIRLSDKTSRLHPRHVVPKVIGRPTPLRRSAASPHWRKSG
jgi:hypothetical protein